MASLRQGITLTLAASASNTDALQLDEQARRTWDLLIVAPGAIPGNPGVVQHSLVSTGGWGNLGYAGGAPVSSLVNISQSQGNIINGVPGIGYLRITVSATSNASKTFQVFGLARPSAVN